MKEERKEGEKEEMARTSYQEKEGRKGGGGGRESKMVTYENIIAGAGNEGRERKGSLCINTRMD